MSPVITLRACLVAGGVALAVALTACSSPAIPPLQHVNLPSVQAERTVEPSGRAGLSSRPAVTTSAVTTSAVVRPPATGGAAVTRTPAPVAPVPAPVVEDPVSAPVAEAPVPAPVAEDPVAADPCYREDPECYGEPPAYDPSQDPGCPAGYVIRPDGMCDAVSD